MAEYIEREALIREIKELRKAHKLKANEEMLFDETDIAGLLASIQAADVAPVRHGKWISTNIAYGEYKCSVCEGMDSDCSDYYSSHSVVDQEYCPWCGAKMDGAE